MDQGVEFVTDIRQRGLQHVRSRDHDDVDTTKSLPLAGPEDLAKTALGGVALHGAAELPRCRNTQACDGKSVGSHEDRHESTLLTRTLIVCEEEELAVMQSLRRTEGLRAHQSHLQGAWRPR